MTDERTHLDAERSHLPFPDEDETTIELFDGFGRDPIRLALDLAQTIALIIIAIALIVIA